MEKGAECMSKTIMHIVGNRPQFIKLAPVSRELKKRGYNDIIIHTGQHFDENMSDVFFEELSIPKPNENLHVSGGTHAQMTAELMKAIEPVISTRNPDVVIVYGDTNSTLAAAITSKKMGKRIVHVEAGVRTGVEFNPEEINRRMIDHISDVLCAPDKRAYDDLVKENLGQKAVFTGDAMLDSYLYCQSIVNNNDKYSVNGIPDHFVLMTWHRQENTSDKITMEKILEAVRKVKEPVVCPLHPRTRKMLDQFGLWNEAESISNFVIIEPVGYMEMVYLLGKADWILTDSGGLSKESYYSQKRCIYMSDLVCWPDLERENWIIHLDSNPDTTYEKLAQLMVETGSNDEKFYGDGNAAVKIVDAIENALIVGD